MAAKLLRYSVVNNFTLFSGFNRIPRVDECVMSYFLVKSKNITSFAGSSALCKKTRNSNIFEAHIRYNISFHLLVRNTETAPVKDYEKQLAGSRLGIELTNEVTAYLRELSHKKSYAESDWKKLHDLLLANSKAFNVNDKNVETISLKCLIEFYDCNLMRSYLLYLRSRKKKISPVTYSAYLKFMYDCWSDHIPDDVNIIKTICDEMLKFPLLECKVAEGLIFGLCLTDRWKESLKVIEKFEQFYDISQNSYSAIIKAALQNNEMDLGAKLLEEKMRTGLIPHQSVYETWLEFSADKKSAFYSLLSVLSKSDEKLYLNVAAVIIKQVQDELKKNYSLQSPAISRVSNM